MCSHQTWQKHKWMRVLGCFIIFQEPDDLLVCIQLRCQWSLSLHLRSPALFWNACIPIHFILESTTVHAVSKEANSLSLKCPYYAILKVPNFVLKVSYKRPGSIQGQKTLAQWGAHPLICQRVWKWFVQRFLNVKESENGLFKDF